MPQADLGHIKIEYETFGAAADAPVLLIMGLGGQLTLWPLPFCEGLARQGFRVVRFDNRDVGKSTHLLELSVPDLNALTGKVMRGEPVKTPYTLDDMALDVVRFMDQLGIAAAHLVGVSLGGMIAQLLAIQHPKRVRSLVSMMSTTGRPDLPPTKPDVLAAIMAPPPSSSRDDLIATRIRAMRVIESPAFAADEEELVARVAESVDRAPFEPTGTIRQMAAVLAATPRHEMLRSVGCPALVIHGADDQLIDVSAGKDTAHCIAGAQLVVINGMGHDVTHALSPVLLEKIVPFLRAAEGSSRPTAFERPIALEWR